MSATSIASSPSTATAQRRHVRPARRIALELSPFEVALLVEGLERHALTAAGNMATLAAAAGWFLRADALREEAIR